MYEEGVNRLDLITDQYHLMYGDCLDRMKEIPDNTVNASLTDLPYGTTRCKWDIPIPFELMWESLLKVVKPNSPMLFTAQSPFDKILGCSNIEMLRYEWIWQKTSATGVACLNTGRKFIGIESDLNNYCIAAERITTHETKRM